MPKYAVAVGRKVGIYDTFAECKEQVDKFPNAKYKKFDTVKDAEEYLKINSEAKAKPKSRMKAFFCPVDSTDSMVVSSPENANPPEMFKVEKMEVSNPLNKRMVALEERFNKFLTGASDFFDEMRKRMTALEQVVYEGRGPPESREASPPRKRAKAEQEAPPYNPPPMNHSNVPTPSTPTPNNLPYKFITDDEGMVVVYTDGACSKNGRMGAKAGVGVWFNHNHPLNVSAPVKGPPTNNTAEIQAARIAINQAVKADVKRLTINTDSKFVINCITQWIHKWKKNNWTLTNGGPVKNKEELIKLDDAVKTLEVVKWNYVAGHNGNVGNEQADRLARSGAQQYRSNVIYNLEDYE